MTSFLMENLPKEWALEKFGDVARIREGQVSPLVKPYKDYLHIGPENIISNTGQIVDLKTALELGLKSGKYLFDERSIVYSKIRPNLNKVCLPDFKGICSADVYPLWPNGVMPRKYLFYFMLSSFFVRQATSVSMRSGFPKINRRDLNLIKIIVPPLQEQEKISEVLSLWDTALYQIEKLIEFKNIFKKALMQQVFGEKIRFHEFTGQPWNAVRLGKLFTERREANREDLPLLSITSERGVIYRDELDKKDTSNTDKSKYKRIAPNDIGYNTMRMWQGVSGLSSLEGIVSPAYTVCIPNKDIVPAFAAYLFKYPPIINLFYRFSQGLVNDTLNLKFGNFAKIRVSIPGKKEQEKIANLFRCLEREMGEICHFRDSLEKQKLGLMQKLFTGKIRVPLDD